MCSGRSPASVGRTKSGCRIPACPLTLMKEVEIVGRAHAGGEISQEQYEEWESLPVGKNPDWLARLMRSQAAA
jgi:hypothetical protein